MVGEKEEERTVKVELNPFANVLNKSVVNDEKTLSAHVKDTGGLGEAGKGKPPSGEHVILQTVLDSHQPYPTEPMLATAAVHQHQEGATFAHLNLWGCVLVESFPDQFYCPLLH